MPSILIIYIYKETDKSTELSNDEAPQQHSSINVKMGTGHESVSSQSETTAEAVLNEINTLNNGGNDQK